MALIPNAKQDDQQEDKTPAGSQQPDDGADQQDGSQGDQSSDSGQPSTQATSGGQGSAQQRPDTPEQDAYEKAMDTVGEMLFQRGAIENIVHSALASQDLGTAVATSVSHILDAVDHHNGHSIPIQSLVQVAVDCIGIIAQMLQSAGRAMTGQDIVTAIQSLLTHYLQMSGATQQEIQTTLSQINPQQLAQLIDKEMQAFSSKGGGAQGASQEPDGDESQGGQGDSDGDEQPEDDDDKNDSAGLSAQVGAAGGDDDEENDEEK